MSHACARQDARRDAPWSAKIAAIHPMTPQERAIGSSSLWRIAAQRMRAVPGSSGSTTPMRPMSMSSEVRVQVKISMP